MKEGANTTFELSGQELLDQAANSKSTLVDRHPIAGTPFEAIKENEKWFAVFGYNKLTEDFEELQEVLDWMEENHWELLVRVITMVVQTIDLHKMKIAKEAYEKQKSNELGTKLPGQMNLNEYEQQFGE